MIRPSRRTILIIVPICVIIIVVAVVFLWAQSSNKATITNSAVESKPTSTPAFKTLTNQYFTFDYPGIYSIVSDTPQTPDLENYLLSADTAYDKHITAALTEGSLATTSAYLYRKSQNNLYSSQDITIGGEAASQWTKSDGSEITVFLPHAGKVLTLSVNVQNTNATGSLATEMSNLLNSFRWQ